MIEWLNLHIEYWHWIVTGLLLAAAEMFIPSFILLWIGVSAIIVGLTLALTPISFNEQLILWMLLSIICLFLWFKYISPAIRTRSHAGMALESLIGQQAMVVFYDAGANSGQIKFPVPVLGNEQWSMICHDKVIPGDRVKITEILGNKLLVHKL